MTLSGPKLNQICDALYEAAAIPDRWPRALAELSWGAEASSGHLTIWNGNSGHAEFAVTARADPVSEHQYSYLYGAMDPLRKYLEHKSCGEWLTNTRHLSPEFIRRDPYHNEFLMPLGFRHTMKCKTNEARGTGTYAIVGFARPPKSEPFQDEDIGRLRQLEPDITRAVRLCQKLAPAREAGRLAETALHGLSFGVLIIAPDRKLLCANDSALAVVKRSPAISVRHGSLHLTNTDHDHLLRKALQGSRDAMWVRLTPGTETDAPLIFSATPLPERVDLPSMKGGRATLLLLSSSGCSGQDLGEALHQLYRLTAAEARVACAIASGQSPLEIAEAAATSTGTVRTQLKSIFAKMAIDRQSQLVAAVLEVGRIASSSR